jgi:hypothetical protein
MPARDGRKKPASPLQTHQNITISNMTLLLLLRRGPLRRPIPSKK